jgi:sec-independent protein translocase protein TatC
MSEDVELSLWDHFEELTSRLRKVFWAILIVFLVVMSVPSDLSMIRRLDFNDYSPIVSLVIQSLQSSLKPEGVTLITLNWLDSFSIYFIMSFAISFAICLPYTAYQLYKFLAPAIYSNEKKALFSFVAVFMALFLFGTAYAYYLLLPMTFRILYRFASQTGVVPLYSQMDFFNMITFGLFGSGIFYTFPLLVYSLVRIGIMRVEDFKSMRKHLFVALAVVTAILTPDPTPISMLLMTIPFYLIFEVTLVVLGRISRDWPDRVVENGVDAAKELLQKKAEAVVP